MLKFSGFARKRCLQDKQLHCGYYERDFLRPVHFPDISTTFVPNQISQIQIPVYHKDAELVLNDFDHLDTVH